MKLTALALGIISLSSFASSVAHAACGQLEVSKGDVKIESGGKSSQASVGAKICSGDTIIAGKDSRAKIKMEDGNELNVSPDSKIALETYQFVPSQNKKKVLLNILQGKVRAATKRENMYNDKSADGSDNTFQVKTKSAVAGVRGTDFLTGFDPKTNKSEVVTFKGKVEFGQPGPGGSITNSVQVGAGQKTEQLPGQPPAPPKPVPPKEMQQLNSETKADTGGQSSNSNSTGGDKKSEKKDGDNGGDKQAAGDAKGDKQSDGKGDKQGDAKGGDQQGDSKGGDKQAAGDKQGGDSKGGDNKQGPGGDKQGDNGGKQGSANGGEKQAAGGETNGGGKQADNGGSGGGKSGTPAANGGGGTNGSGTSTEQNSGGQRPVANNNEPSPTRGPANEPQKPAGPESPAGPAAPGPASPGGGPIAAPMPAPGGPGPGPGMGLPPPPPPTLGPIIAGPPIILPPPVPVIPQVPVCQTCLDVPKGPTRLIINISVK